MTMKSWSGLLGVAMLVVSSGCARHAVSPSQESSTSSPRSRRPTRRRRRRGDAAGGPHADPASVTIAAGNGQVLNKSGRYAKVHSYNCSEFSGVNLPNGGWVNTWAFKPAGKTCDFFVWDVNWSRKLFEGQVVVQ
jgi:hypothetical protein